MIPDAGYLQGLRKICDARGWLLMLDEIQTGMCRTGRWFACQHEQVQPDVMTLAKGLGNGVPIGACLAYGKAARVFQAGSHGSTFGGNPLACSAALAVLKTLEDGRFEQRAAQLGQRILTGLQQNLAQTAGVHAIRGKGLMIAIELNRPCKELLKAALDRGLLINVANEKIVRLLPPLIVSEDEADRIVHVLTDVVRVFLEKR